MMFETRFVSVLILMPLHFSVNCERECNQFYVFAHVYVCRGLGGAGVSVCLCVCACTRVFAGTYLGACVCVCV